MRDGVADDSFCELIRHAALAGALSYWSRREPAAAGGLNRLAEKERALASALLNEMVEGPVHTQADRPTNAR